MDNKYITAQIEAANSAIRLLQGLVQELKDAKNPTITFKQILIAGMKDADTDFKSYYPFIEG